MKFKVLIIIFIILLGIIFLFRDEIFNFYSEVFEEFPQIKEKTSDFLVEKIGKEVITPPPLRSSKENPQSFLTRAGTIQWTNTQRKENGLSPLSESTKLNLAAEKKLEDMFKKQYFGHISPSGLGAGDLAENFGYEFILVGENLALGNFKDDQELVQAWMDSPGHRANILNNRYQDIGVAVYKDTFEGEIVWLAVQIFGLPLSSCPQPNEALKAQIEIYDSQLKELQIKIESLQKEIQFMRPKRGSTYNQKVDEYNQLVNQYNDLLSNFQAMVSQYNNQVNLFNECILK